MEIHIFSCDIRCCAASLINARVLYDTFVDDTLSGLVHLCDTIIFKSDSMELGQACDPLPILTDCVCFLGYTFYITCGYF